MAKPIKTRTDMLGFVLIVATAFSVAETGVVCGVQFPLQNETSTSKAETVASGSMQEPERKSQLTSPYGLVIFQEAMQMAR